MNAFTVLAASLACGAALAQVSNLPNTGCPTQGFPTVSGTPSLGRSFGTAYTGGGRAIVFSAAGTLLASPMQLSPPLACVSGCTIAINPILVVPAPAWSTVVPNNPALIGVCLGAQHALFGVLSPACIELSGAVQFCIQP